MSIFHLAQINIARARGTMESKIMEGFVDRLDEINSLAEKSPGFVWRLQTEDGDATSIQVFDDPALIINMSIWEDLDALKHFVYRTVHIDLIRDREAWFSKIVRIHQVLWWVPNGYIPSPEEGKEKLDYLEKHGPSREAFTFAKHFPRP